MGEVDRHGAGIAVRGLVLIAALGNPSAFPLVRSNLRHFHGWDCIAYAHVKIPPEERFLIVSSADNTSTTECQLVSRPNWGWASLLNLSTPEATSGYSHVFVLLDDVFLPHDAFSLHGLLTVMRRANLNAVSPTVSGAARIGVSPLQRVRKLPEPPLEGGCVHVVPVIEIFATLFSAAAWRCFHSLFADEVLETATGAVGWGYDLCFKAHCAPRALGRFGVALSQYAVHTEGPKVIAHVNKQVRRSEHLMHAKHAVGERWVQETPRSLDVARKSLENLGREMRKGAELSEMYSNELAHVRAALGTSTKYSNELANAMRFVPNASRENGTRWQVGRRQVGRRQVGRRQVGRRQEERRQVGRRLSMHAFYKDGTAQAVRLKKWVKATDGTHCSSMVMPVPIRRVVECE